MSGSSSTTSTWLAMAPILPTAGLAQLEDPGAIGGNAESARLREHAARRLVERLVGEVEGSPVDAEEDAAPEVDGGLYGLLRGRVDEPHDGGRQVGPDGGRGEIGGPQAVSPPPAPTGH